MDKILATNEEESIICFWYPRLNFINSVKMLIRYTRDNDSKDANNIYQE